MKVNFICGYYSDQAHKAKRRTEPYWDAYFYVWAVKSGRFKKRFILPYQKNNIAISSDNFEIVRKSFGKFIESVIKTERYDRDSLLVPIPSKDGVVGSSNFRTSLMIQEAVAGTAFEKSPFEGLHWKTQLQQAHLGGRRNRELLKSHLLAHQDVRDKNVILVDDLLSTGSSFLAAKDILTDAGANVIGAIACGRTIYDTETKPFGYQSIELNSEIHEIGKIFLLLEPSTAT